MDRRYSPIADMYGAAPEDHSQGRKSHPWLYVLLTIGCFFVIESIRPVMRLRPDPPLSLVVSGHNGNGSESEIQEQLARECWNYAIVSLQDIYPYGSELPQSPPSRLSSESRKTSATSAFCWQKLRNAWGKSDSWERAYEWSTDWITNPDGPFQQAIHSVLRHAGIT